MTVEEIENEVKALNPKERDLFLSKLLRLSVPGMDQDAFLGAVSHLIGDENAQARTGADADFDAAAERVLKQHAPLLEKLSQ